MSVQKSNEIAILTSYEPMLRKIVHSFIRRCSVKAMSAEDLMQEARIAFLRHIRTHEPKDCGRCRLTIIHALCDAVLNTCPVSMPRGVFLVIVLDGYEVAPLIKTEGKPYTKPCMPDG